MFNLVALQVRYSDILNCTFEQMSEIDALRSLCQDNLTSLSAARQLGFWFNVLLEQGLIVFQMSFNKPFL